ncbi:MAG: chloramphenicol acetyltransferase CAT [Clostridia bacterium]|nr:chloramphenicol acetyltransferase CAT [Clostridia bacterium]
MTTEESFVPIQMEAWPRAQLFYYYTKIAPTSYTVDVMMDVTVLRKELKRRGLKFFPAYLWLMTSTIGGIEELRVGAKDGVLGYWKQLTPAYPQFHEDDKTTSLLWTEYHDSFSVFYENYIKDTKEYAPSHGIVSAKGIPLPNAYVISCIPWFTFQSFSLHNHGIKDYYFPSFEAGKFVEADGKTLMPLSVTVHHATTDGYHLKQLFEKLQDGMNHPVGWL